MSAGQEQLGIVMALDTETTGIEESDRLFGYSIANESQERFLREKPDHHFKRMARDPNATWVFNNALFDMRMMGYEGVEIAGKCIDVGVMARIIKNDHLGSRDYSLAAQALRHLAQTKITAVEEEIKKKQLYQVRKDYFGEEYKVPCYHLVDHDLMNTYAARDARLTYDLYKKYIGMMDADDRRVLDNEVALTKVIYKMERHGLRLDTDYTLRAYYHEQAKLDEAIKNFKVQTGHDFVNSAKSIEKSLNITLPKTEKGNPTLTDDVIDEWVDQYPSLELVRTIRYHEKRIATYYKNYLNFQRDGIVRPSYHQYGTRTGRFSSSNPNIQNVPAEEESTDEFVVRGCFMPHEGDVFVAIDYKQQEFRLALDYAGETKLIDAIMQGADPHQATADLAGISRKHAKTLNFATIYGAGPAKIALMLGIPEREAKMLLMQYFARLPKLERLIWDVQRVGKTRGYVKNWFGRKLRADFNYCYALPNHLIQSSGADVMKKAMVEIDKAYPHIKIIASIHDELVFSMKEEHLDSVKDLQRIMESQYIPKNGVVLHTDASISKRSLAKRDMEKL